jgi:hypothetical protein
MAISVPNGYKGEDQRRQGKAVPDRISGLYRCSIFEQKKGTAEAVPKKTA